MHATFLALALLAPAEPYYNGGGRGSYSGEYYGPRGGEVDFRGSYERERGGYGGYDPRFGGMEQLEYLPNAGRYEVETFFRRTPGGGIELARLVLRRVDGGYPPPRPRPYPYVERGGYDRGPAYSTYPGAPPPRRDVAPPPLPRLRESRTPGPAPSPFGTNGCGPGGCKPNGRGPN